MLKQPVKITRTPSLPPKTRGLPVIGVLPHLLKNPLTFLLDAREKHGDLYTLDVGLAKIIILNHPRHAQYILRENPTNYVKGGPLWEGVRTILGNGLVVSQGDFWLRQRRMIQPQFHHKRIGVLVDLMVEAITEGLDEWEEAKQQNIPFDVAHGCTRIAMRVILKTMFRTGLVDDDLDKLEKSLSYALDYMMQHMMTDSLPTWIPNPGRNKQQEAVATVDEIIFRVIEARRCMENDDATDLLSMLLHATDEGTGEQMNDQQLRDELVTVFLAGYETTATALAWTFYLLTQNHHIAQKLYQEVDTALDGRPPAFADIPNLTYARMVMQESLRMYPPVYWIPRTSVNEDEIDGFHIPANTMIASLIQVIHHHPEIWDAPETFDPERFTQERSAERHNLAWMPFGSGQRLCAGKDFALIESQLVLAMVAQRYKLTAPQGYHPKPHISATLKTKGGIWVNLADRS